MGSSDLAFCCSISLLKPTIRRTLCFFFPASHLIVTGTSTLGISPRLKVALTFVWATSSTSSGLFPAHTNVNFPVTLDRCLDLTPLLRHNSKVILTTAQICPPRLHYQTTDFLITDSVIRVFHSLDSKKRTRQSGPTVMSAQNRGMGIGSLRMGGEHTAGYCLYDGFADSRAQRSSVRRYKMVSLERPEKCNTRNVK